MIQRFILFSLEGDIAGSILCQHFIVSLAWKGAGSQQENVENESQAEDIAYGVILGTHVFDVDDFRGHVPWCSASDEQILGLVGEFRQPEIRYHAVPISLFSENQILRFQVPMHDLPRMHLPQSLQYRSNYGSCFLGFELVLGFDLIIEQSALQQLYYDIQGIFGLEDLEEFHAIGVIEGSHDVDLLDEALLALVLTVGCLLGERLHCIVTTILRFLGQVDRCKVALTYFLLGLELLMEASLIQSRFEHFPAVGEIGLRTQLIGVFLLGLLKAERGWCECEAILDVEVQMHMESPSGGGLGDGSFEECQRDVSLLGAVCRAGEEELAGLEGCHCGEEGQAGLHSNIMQPNRIPPFLPFSKQLQEETEWKRRGYFRGKHNIGVGWQWLRGQRGSKGNGNGSYGRNIFDSSLLLYSHYIIFIFRAKIASLTNSQQAQP